jgi:hypothetical protein
VDANRRTLVCQQLSLLGSLQDSGVGDGVGEAKVGAHRYPLGAGEGERSPFVAVRPGGGLPLGAHSRLPGELGEVETQGNVGVANVFVGLVKGTVERLGQLLDNRLPIAVMAGDQFRPHHPGQAAGLDHVRGHAQGFCA